MDVYASVDQRTRHKLEEMLQTWKEPVPGSIDSNPVFPSDVIRPIENALLKARTSALQAHQEQVRRQMGSRGGKPPVPGYRATPTPPNARQPFTQPPYPGTNGVRSASAFAQQPYQQPQVRVSRPLVRLDVWLTASQGHAIRCARASAASICTSDCALCTATKFLRRSRWPTGDKLRLAE